METKSVAGIELPASGLIAGYRAPAGHYDELTAAGAAGREVRPHWRRMVDALGAMGAAELDARAGQLARQVRENGITYNVYGEAGGAGRPWSQDLLPFVLPQAEWARLADGIEQRARLLNAVMADLYGALRLPREGLLPPALVFGHPGYLRACHGLAPPAGVYLHLVALDLARDPEGHWWVVSQRTQTPSGAGYALENRLISARLLPDPFRGLHVRRLSHFFRCLQNTLIELAPAAGERPHIALLSPGPYSETYFEHAYLARYLGYTLAEGADLTVRGERLYLKTVEGLRPVHVLLRRLDDDFCDPLELRSDSQLGIPGLLQAVRAGQLLLANALGSAPLESPAIMGFLPRIARELLGEELRLPSVCSWWCGEEAALAEALPRLNELLIKPATPRLRFEPVFGSRLDRTAAQEWHELLRQRPADYVLQGLVPLSCTPGWQGGALAPRELMLRVFAVADGRGGYRVMPGGLTRVAAPGRRVVSMQRGGGSKDTWISGDSPAPLLTLLPGRITPAELKRATGNVSSRAGENLFWMGRYAERSENAVRLARALLARLAEGEELGGAVLGTLLRTGRRNGLLPERDDLAGLPGEALWPLLRECLLDPDEHFGLAFGVSRLHQCAAIARDRISPDNWRFISQLRQRLEDARDQADDVGEALELLDACVLHLVAVSGLAADHMTRNHGWRLLSAGRHLERVVFLAGAFADAMASGQHDSPALLDWLLELGDSGITYRARYSRTPELLPCIDLLVLDAHNPRSITAQLVALASVLRPLPQPEPLAQILAAALGALDPREPWLDALTGSAPAPFLSERFAALARRMAEISDGLGAAYFVHSQPPATVTRSL